MRDAIGEGDVRGGITSGSVIIFSARIVLLLLVTTQPIAGEASAMFELELRIGCFPFSIFCGTCDCLPQVTIVRRISFNLDITVGKGLVTDRSGRQPSPTVSARRGGGGREEVEKAKAKAKGKEKKRKAKQSKEEGGKR